VTRRRAWARARAAALAVAGATSLAASPALAAPPWVERELTLPRHDWAFDFGLGVGHYDQGPRPGQSGTGPGLNAEMKVSVIHHLELGFRGGFRFGDEAKFSRADQYGRIFDRQTFGTRGEGVASPEVKVLGEVVDTGTFELGLEGRIILPTEAPNHFATQFGMPFAIHIADFVRLDTGVYIPIVFDDRTPTAISVPFDAWFQVSPRVWLGPMTGFRHDTPPSHDSASLGFGVGYQVHRIVDLKWMLLWPRITDDRGGTNVGGGFGAQIRIE